MFYWPKIEKVTFSKKKFTILVAEDDTRGLRQEHTFIFHLVDEKACKHLWKCAVEYHAFFRLRSTPRQLVVLQSSSTTTTTTSATAAGKSMGLISGFIRRGSRFRGPERTEYQAHTLIASRLSAPRRSVQFERRPSQRFTRRASYAVKRKQQECQNPNAKLTDTTQQTAAATASAVVVVASASPSSHQNALVPSLSDAHLNTNATSDNHNHNHTTTLLSTATSGKTNGDDEDSRRVHKQSNSNNSNNKSGGESGAESDRDEGDEVALIDLNSSGKELLSPNPPPPSSSTTTSTVMAPAAAQPAAQVPAATKPAAQQQQQSTNTTNNTNNNNNNNNKNSKSGIKPLPPPTVARGTARAPTARVNSSLLLTNASSSSKLQLKVMNKHAAVAAKTPITTEL